jgi:hypothetical protein
MSADSRSIRSTCGALKKRPCAWKPAWGSARLLRCSIFILCLFGCSAWLLRCKLLLFGWPHLQLDLSQTMQKWQANLAHRIRGPSAFLWSLARTSLLQLNQAARYEQGRLMRGTNHALRSCAWKLSCMCSAAQQRLAGSCGPWHVSAHLMNSMAEKAAFVVRSGLVVPVICFSFSFFSLRDD